MSYDGNHWLLAFGGKLNTEDSWTCTLRFAASNDSSTTTGSYIAFAAAQAAGIHAKVKTWWNSNLTSFSADTKFGFSKFNAIGVDGLYLDRDNANSVYESGTGVAGTGAANFPGYVAIAVSLVTGASRGLAHRGRIYVPFNAWTPWENGRLQDSVRDGFAAKVAALVSSVNTTPNDPVGGDVACTIMSKGHKVGTPLETTGTRHKVTGVICGNVPDVQRRRVHQMTETFSAPVAVTG